MELYTFKKYKNSVILKIVEEKSKNIVIAENIDYPGLFYKVNRKELQKYEPKTTK